MDNFISQLTPRLQDLLLQTGLTNFIPDSLFRYAKFFPIFVIAFIVAVLLTPIIGHSSRKLGIVDVPGKKRQVKLNKYDNPDRHIHKKATPILGGVAVILPFLLFLSFFFEINPTTIALIASTLLLTITGVLDDIYNLPASIQFISQVAAALIIALVVVDFAIISVPIIGNIDLDWARLGFNLGGVDFNLTMPGDLLIIPWILLCINALKWVSGSDGLLEGNMVIAFLLIATLGVRTQSAEIVAMSTFLAGGISGFLVFNFPPAKIFSASVGKTLYGFLVAVLAIMGSSKIATTILIIALPLVDAIFVVIRRYIVHKPKNLFDLMRINGRDHLHHQLLKIGLSPRRILLIEGSITLLFGSIAVLTTGAVKFFILIFALFLLSLLILYINYSAEREKPTHGETEQEDSPESKYRY